MSGNLTLQYQLTHSMSVQAAYVTSLARHLEAFPGSNNVSQILPASLPAGEKTSQFLPLPDFSRGASYAATEGSSAYQDRKSTRLNSSHSQISYAVFCLKKKKIYAQQDEVVLNRSQL